jgi:glycerophosphoryl diester phosphodiesterase
MNIAHRGSSWSAPENTLEAFDLAVRDEGAGGLELDVQRTRDGHPVVLHDETLDRTTNGHGPVAALDLEQVRRLDAGFHFRPPLEATEERFPWRARGARIPTLVEVLERYPTTWLSIDLKRGDPLTEQAAVLAIRAAHAQDRVVLGAESHAGARRLRALAPDLQSFFSARDARAFYLRHRLRWWMGYRPPARSLQIPPRHGRWNLVTPRLLEDAHRRGIAVRYWTVNDPAIMTRLLQLGVDGIITDRPAVLRELLTRGGGVS